MTFWQRKRGPINKKKVVTGILLCCVLTYIGASLVDYDRYTGNKFWRPVPECFDSQDHTNRLTKLAHKIHLILESMGIEHWLMYGSLWGPLRGIPGPLPWDHDVDIGMNGDGNFSKIPVDEFKARFEAAGLGVVDELKVRGSFSVLGKNESLGLFLFYNRRGIMMRSGYEPWVLYIHYRLRHTFPARLVQQPLPKVRFGSFNISFPRGGIEIMKHLYPFNWWKVVKPANCKN